MHKLSLVAGLVSLVVSGLSCADGVREVSRNDVSQMPDAVAQVQKAITAVTDKQAKGAQVVAFPFHENEIYQIPLKTGMFVTFSIPKNEPIKQFALSDPSSVELNINPDANIAMLKLVNNVTVPATIVTDKHVYYLNIKPSDGEWDQGVSWRYDTTTTNGFGYKATATSADAAPSQFVPPDLDNGLTGQPNFNYSFKGDQAIMPISVWDNGKFTWIQFPNNIQSIPAVFYYGKNGAEVVNYVVQPGGKQILVNRLMDKFMLRLGDLKVMAAAK